MTRSVNISGVPPHTPLVQPDPGATERFLRLLYAGAAQGYLTLTHKQGELMLTDFIDISSTSMDRIATRASTLAAGYDVYFGVGLRREKLAGGKRGNADSVCLLPAIWMDIDILDPAHAQEALPPDEKAAVQLLHTAGLEPTLIVRSGHGIHGYYAFDRPLEIQDGNRLRAKILASHLHRLIAAAARHQGWKLDNTSDLARILRPAGTVNHKDPQNPKLVTFEASGPRYEFAEIERRVASGLSNTATGGFVGFDGFEAKSKVSKNRPEGEIAALAPQAANGITPDQGDFQPAHIEPIVLGCAWMRHCRDDAAALPEPEWYAMLSVLGCCENGEQLAYEWSRPYPGYTQAETQKKLRHALEAAGPVTCATVMDKLGQHQYCEPCLCREFVVSPRSLGKVKPPQDDNDMAGTTMPAVEAVSQVVDPSTGSVPPVAEVMLIAEANPTPADPPISPALSEPQAVDMAKSAPAAPPQAEVGTPPPPPGFTWPKPEVLKTALPPVPAFNPELLPGVCWDYAVDVSERMQVPLDFPAVALLLGIATAVGRRAMIMPKERDHSWQVVPNLWGGIVSRPGNLKSPLINAIFRPLKALEKAAIEAHQAAMEDYEKEFDEWDARKKKELKDNGSFDEEKPQKPTALRFLVNDATIEKLHDLLADNPQGVLLFRDELAGWFAGLDTKGHERERPFFLEGWNGDGSYTTDRIGRGTLYVEFLCISVFGGIQPAKLQNYLVDAVIGGGNDDGLVQRLQVVVWPDQASEWQNVDRPPNMVAANAVERMFGEIVAIQVEQLLLARFDPKAQQLFDAWRARLEYRVRKGDLPRYLESHLAKYRSLMPSIALLLHIADGGRQPEVPLIQAQRAAAWCEYLEAHAIRVYSCVTGVADRAATALAAKIQKGVLGEQFTARQVYIKGWTGLAKVEQVHEALGVLQEAGWVRPHPLLPGVVGGRPTEIYQVNPEVYHE